MPNPYSAQPDHAFWSRAVARPSPETVDPVIEPKFRLSRRHQIATAGSCFAQHIARTLAASGFGYLVTEPGPVESNYGVFPARFGNIYSTRQFLQLFQRAYGLFHPQDFAWPRPDGVLVDPFRPQIEPTGFSSLAALREDHETHFAAVRAMFETCNVLVFTLGLTEAWVSKRDGAVFPLAPGVVASPERTDSYAFQNFTVSEMVADLVEAIEKMRVVNPGVRVILTVSPVPLIATYEQKHVLVATTYSKSALRVVAEMVSQSIPDVAYFPSYEIITGHHTHYKFFAEDLRSVTPDGVDHVMKLFKRHYLSEGNRDEVREASHERKIAVPESHEKELNDLYQVICEEEAIET